MSNQNDDVDEAQGSVDRADRIAGISKAAACLLRACSVCHRRTAPAAQLGEPSGWVIFLLGLSFSAKIVEVLWLQGQSDGISERTAHLETALSSIGIFALAVALAFLTNRDDSPYFVLLAIPILQCAYHCGLLQTLLAVVGSVGMIFWWSVH